MIDLGPTPYDVVRRVTTDVDAELVSMGVPLGDADRYGRISIGQLMTKPDLVTTVMVDWLQRIGLVGRLVVLRHRWSLGVIVADVELLFIESQGIIEIYYGGERVFNPFTIKRRLL